LKASLGSSIGNEGSRGTPAHAVRRAARLDTITRMNQGAARCIRSVPFELTRDAQGPANPKQGDQVCVQNQTQR
jgi:hypothetical protein